jgi:hypothetical protein
VKRVPDMNEMRPRAVKVVDLNLETAGKTSTWETIKESATFKFGRNRDTT